MNQKSQPPRPVSFSLPSPPLVDLKSQLPPMDWPHAPVHRLADNAVYFVTASTLHKQHFFDTPAKRDLLERFLLSFAKTFGWKLEAWAVFANHSTSSRAEIPTQRTLANFSTICMVFRRMI